MAYITDFIGTNWALVLLAAAMLILIKTTVYINKTTSARLLIIVLLTVFLAVASYIEVTLGNSDTYSAWRAILSCFKYAVPPVMLAVVSCIIFNETRWYMFIPAEVNALITFLSLATGWVFRITEENSWQRGPLGYLPFIVDGLYLFYFIWKLFVSGNKHFEDTAPLAFLAVTSTLCIVMPLVWGYDFEKWFGTTVMIDVFVYYIYLLQQLTKKDALTGLLNRQSYYSDMVKYKSEITAVVSIDMNGLKTANDTKGHAEGDRALVTLANCFAKSVKTRQRVYRVGGDEFMILCTRTDEAGVEKLVEKIRGAVSATPYTCSVGYCVCEAGKSLDETIKISDERMYEEKAEHYRRLKAQNGE